MRELLGDPHLGRAFTRGVPLARRGEREKLVLQQFKSELQVGPDCRMHICMGDLFDKPQVSYDVLIKAACVYNDAAWNHPNCTFYILQGNHDDSRDLAEVTAWDVFGMLTAQRMNIECVTDAKIAVDGSLLLPWHPTRSAVEQLAMVDTKDEELSGVAYGHYDVDPRSAAHNLIPTKELAALGITKAYTGHIHLPSTFRRDGVDVTVVGSMQPYAQGEDGGQSHIRYVSLTLDQLVDAGDLTTSCVRLLLRPGETVDDIPDCMSWNVERLDAKDEAAPVDVSMEGFDTNLAYVAAFEPYDILPSVREKIDAKWQEISSSVA